jgi:hypothetical protein
MRTRYAIKLTEIQGWLGENLETVFDLSIAMRFDSMTQANYFAIVEMRLSLQDFIVEAV